MAGLAAAGVVLLLVAGMLFGDRIEHWLLRLHGH